MFQIQGILNRGGPNQARDSLIAPHRSDQTAVERRPVPSVRGANVSGRERLCLLMAHETPGDPLVRGLPSPVCTRRASSQSRRQETVTDPGKCPAQEWEVRRFATTILKRPPVTVPTLTLTKCCLAAPRDQWWGITGRVPQVDPPTAPFAATAPVWPSSRPWRGQALRKYAGRGGGDDATPAPKPATSCQATTHP
jgi:hypothetical protein